MYVSNYVTTAIGHPSYVQLRYSMMQNMEIVIPFTMHSHRQEISNTLHDKPFTMHHNNKKPPYSPQSDIMFWNVYNLNTYFLQSLCTI